MELSRLENTASKNKAVFKPLAPILVHSGYLLGKSHYIVGVENTAKITPV